MTCNTCIKTILLILLGVRMLIGCGVEEPDIPDLDPGQKPENTEFDPSITTPDIDVWEDDKAINNTSNVTSDDLETYLRGYDSPLVDYADVMILACKEHDCDPCLIVAIGMAESTLGRFMKNEYNFWGYQQGNHAFKSWESAIVALAWEFGEEGNHRDKHSLEEILNKPPQFCTEDCGDWLYNVTTVYNEIPGCNDNTDLTFSGIGSR